MKTIKDAKLVKSIIENRVNTWDGEYEQKTYHIEVSIDKGIGTSYALEVRPLNGDTLYCIETLVEVTKCFQASMFISIENGKIYARIH